MYNQSEQENKCTTAAKTSLANPISLPEMLSSDKQQQPRGAGVFL